MLLCVININFLLQLVSDALNHMVMFSEFQHDSLISRIAALHIVHWATKSQILWFGQLVSHSPSIMESLLGVLPPNDFPEMVLWKHVSYKDSDDTKSCILGCRSST